MGELSGVCPKRHYHPAVTENVFPDGKEYCI